MGKRKGDKCPPGCRCKLHRKRPKGGKCPVGCHCGRHRHKQRPATKEKISKGLIKHYKERGHLPSPGRKKCNDCKKWKDVPTDFYMKKQKLKSGDTVQYPDACCKKCRLKRNKKYMDEKTPEERSEIWKAQRASMIKRHGAAKIRKKEREKKAVQRDKAGKPPPKKRKIRSSSRVKQGPLAEFVRAQLKERGWTQTELAHKAGIDRSALGKMLNKPASETIELSTVDRILLALDHEEMLTILYHE